MEPEHEFDDHDEEVDDHDAVDQYAADVVAAAEAFGVPIPDDFPIDQVRR